MAHLLAEDLLLLLLDDERGTVRGVTIDLRVPLGAAVLVQLALDGAVRIEEPASRWHAAKVAVVGGAVSEPVLADALTLAAEKPRAVGDLANRIGKGLRERLAQRLADQGVLERREDTVLGLFPRTRWPARSVAHESEVREALRGALLGDRTPDPRTAVLAGILGALDRIPAVLGVRGEEARAAKRRARGIADGDWASEAVRNAVRSAAAATTAAVAASVAATSAGT